jgi:hypothetical protein
MTSRLSNQGEDRATGASGRPRHAAALRSATQGALQEIPLYLKLVYLLVQPGNDTSVILLILSLVTTEDADGTLRHGNPSICESG